MAYLRIFIAVLLSLMLSSNKSGAESSQLESVYVSLYGQDCNYCGSQGHPCKSIAQAVRQVHAGGIIFLDGSGTDKHPFNCASSLPDQGFHPGVNINKNLTMKGLYSTPHVFCVEGFHFQKTNDEQQTLRFELSGIAFWQTNLTFENCSHVKIVNCSFHNTPRALSIRIESMTTFRLDIQGFSTFYNNSHCIHLLLLDNVGKKSRRFVGINISGTHFKQNGLYSVKRFERGVLKIVSSKHKVLKQIDIRVSCEKVKCVKNQGPFMNLKAITAVTNETYKDMELNFNRLPSWKNSLNKKQKHTVPSLYFSQARKTRAKFVNLKCNNNPSVQCIKVQSVEANIDIQDSYFYKQSAMKIASSCLSVEAFIGASLRILNTTFSNNEADFSGSLFVDSPGGILYINLTNVRFSKCSANRYGCAITVGKPSWAGHHKESWPEKLFFNLQNVTIEHWGGKSKWTKCAAIHILLKGGKVTAEETKFHNKTQKTLGALRVLNTGGKTKVTVSKCSFIDNAAKAFPKNRFKFIQIVAFNSNAGIVTLADSLIVSKPKNKEGLFISPKYRFKLVNITLIGFSYGLHVKSSSPKNTSFPVDILIDNCTFKNNVYDMLLTICNPTSVQVIIRNTNFTSSSKEIVENNGRGYAVRLHIPPLTHITSSKADIELDNNIFNSRPSSHFALFFEGEKNVTIRRTQFRNCVNAHRFWWFAGNAYFYETATGAISILTNPDKSWQLGCVRPNATHEIHPSWNYDTFVVFEDTTFVENVGLAAGAVYVSNGFTKFRRCTFHDNFGTYRTGHVYSAYGTGRVDFEDCSFSRTKKNVKFSNTTFNNPTFLYSESGGPLKLKNTSLTSLYFDRNSNPALLDISSGGYVEMDETSKLQCSEGQELLFENATHIIYTEKNNSVCQINVTVLRYSCRSCYPGYYSLQKGASRGLTVATAVLCLPCPFGSTCIQSNIAAKPNFWGYQSSNHPPKVEFIACPEHYCPSVESANYNSCNGNRNGTLCGKCADGFTETLFSAECCQSTECNNYTVWILTILLTFALVLYLLKKPPILSFLGTQILWFNKRVENHSRDELGLVEDCEHSDSGYIKITFYFYQAAELLMVGSIEDCLHKIPFIYIVIAAFNFQVRTINRGIGCPFVGLTAVTKQLLLSGTVVVTMTEVVIVYGVHVVINMIRGKEKPTLIHYMAVVMEVLLLGYERLAETSLTLMHCVSIGSGKWLFIDANVPCMQWWQYILLAYIIVFVGPFIIVLYYGSSKLYRASITTSEFLTACMIPLPFLIYWLVKDMLARRRGVSTSVQVVNKDVLEILHGPFRKPNGDDEGTLYWESVLIGRRFLLLACQSFITNLMLRMVCMVAACILMTIHHVLMKPFRNPLANKAETLSLTALSMIAVINLAKATLISFGISIDGPEIPYFETLEWFEVVALAFVPALVSLLVTFAILSQLARLLVFLVKKCYHSCWKFPSHLWLMDPLREPLLDSAEQNNDDEP
ncbi:uncharacterized protein LOC144654277 isoform X2 [Oculina patagonica]